jgi:hypothetical protein
MGPSLLLARALDDERSRLAEESARLRRLALRPAPHSLRRALGGALVSLGQRLAAESHPQPARSP